MPDGAERQQREKGIAYPAFWNAPPNGDAALAIARILAGTSIISRLRAMLGMTV